MRACAGPDELRAAHDQVTRLARGNFGDGGVFLERYVARARHVEVQVFGDGTGRVVSLGDRDCSLQRRHQKVLEEAPAPGLPAALREQLHRSARELCASVGYRSAGTVEFVYDAEREEAAFLEVNTRLQVEHPVTEQITGVDLVGWMLRLARGEQDLLAGVGPDGPPVRGHAVEARLYAEDPGQDHRPSSGLLTRVELPATTPGTAPGGVTGGAPGGAPDGAPVVGIRVDGWVETGQEVSPAYDPMLAKVIATGRDRAEAFARLAEALEATRIDGVETNLGLLRAACRTPEVLAARHTTATLAGVTDPRPRIDVVRGGTLTTVQDWPGRTGHWDVGIPPGGPMDDLSFRLGNTAVGNPPGAPGLECTLEGPALRFSRPAVVCVTGAPAPVTVDGAPAAQWEPLDLPAGALLEVGTPAGPGMRTYVLVRGGLDLPAYLGSTATFTLGGFGGHAGRALRTGDVLRPADPAPGAPAPAAVPAARRPHFTTRWRLAVSEGPHPAPDFLTRAGLRTVYGADWKVSAQSARTGVRLIGPRPEWARPDGGEAGLHPSNVHDTAYSVGAVNLTGDTPAILGPDGPSLGGFACPFTVVAGERWKAGQLRPGDTVRFVPVTEARAAELRRSPAPRTLPADGPDPDDGVLARRPATDTAPEVVYRRGADDNILVEYGPMALDLALRMRVHALAGHLAAHRPRGLVDITPGVRSLHLHTDPDALPLRTLLGLLQEAEDRLPAAHDLTVPSREVHLPLSWDDPTVDEAISRYRTSVRDDAPWNPSNIEFIRRINGLDSVDDVRRTVFDARYLVLGLGDVYLGAPAATPLDPRHRLVTTKYNPARTWTAEAGVGIGGSYLCVYGMESPGGYQLIGRTVPIWGGLRPGRSFADGIPWLLRFFDRIVWHPVSPAELLDVRADLAAGRRALDIRPGTFSLAAHERFLAENADDIAAFRARQSAAFAAERRAWEAAGELADRPEPVPAPAVAPRALPPGAGLVEAPLSSSVWKVAAAPGTRVAAGQPLIVLEAMKMEVVVRAPSAGVVADVLVAPGQQIDAGTPLTVVLREEAA